MIRRTLLPLAALLLSAPAAAHDFWIDLPSYRADAEGVVAAKFLIGDIGEVEPWDLLWRKTVSLRIHGPDGVADAQAGIRPTTPADPGGATLRVGAPGTYLVAFESYQAENDIVAAEFNEYAAHEGLTPALAQRARDGTADTRGRELYSRRAKALVQVGETLSDTVTRPIGQTLEIVPERNPYALRGDDPLPVRIYYRGAPLAGASVVMEPLDGATAHGKPVITDATGRASFPFTKRGRWRIGVVWTQPIEHPRAEFDTVFSSLTFGL